MGVSAMLRYAQEGREQVGNYRNYMETVVEELFDEYGESWGCCPCPHCRDDIIAYTLNLLPPRYIVTTPGAAFAKLDSLQKQYRADIVTALSRAADLVSKSPRHE